MDSAELIETLFRSHPGRQCRRGHPHSPTRIHVVFTDIQMPGVTDGLKLARFVRNRWPLIKIVATSGLLQVEDDDLPAGDAIPWHRAGRNVAAINRRA
jgi:CheY-like chemotaxis protein